MYPPAPPPPSHDHPHRRFPWTTLAAIALLTAAAILLGQRDWAVPQRVLGGFEVAAVPSSLLGLVLAVTATSLVVGAWVVRRDGALRLRDAAFAGWVVASLLVAAVLVWNAVFMAANAEFETGPIIPVFHWLFTFLPALLAGLVARRRGRGAASAAALATGVVTLPLFALGWSLLASREALDVGVVTSAWNTVLLGVVPLALAVAIGRSGIRRDT